MAGRERRRVERRKRKERGRDRRVQIAARYEERNRAARQRLEPLAQNERPTVVTVSAVIAAVIAAGSPIAYVILALLDASRPPLINVIWPALLMGMAAYGMWRARYWAVLGFDVILVFLMIVAVGGLIEAKNALAAVVFTALIAGTGTLFYFMVKAMARIQMPERRTPGSG